MHPRSEYVLDIAFHLERRFCWNRTTFAAIGDDLIRRYSPQVVEHYICPWCRHRARHGILRPAISYFVRFFHTTAC